MLFASRFLHNSSRARQRLASFLAFLWFDFFRIRRQVIIDNIAKAFPDWSTAERIRIGRESLFNWALTFVEYAHFPSINKQWVQQNFEIVNRHHFDDVMKEGKGAVMITLHMGNGDLACAALSLSGYPISMVSKIFKWKTLNDFWFALRERVGIQLIPPRDASFAVLRAIKNGRIVIFPLDQYTGNPIGIKTSFFGIETGTAMGPAIIADRSACPVILCYTLRLPDGRHQIMVERIDRVALQGPKDSEERNRAIKEKIQEWNDQIEKWVRRRPEQWMWLHKRWKRFT